MRTTPSPTRLTLTLGVLAVLTLTAGCTEAGPSDAEISASWAAQDEAQKAADEAEAVQEAEQAIRDYMHVSSQCLADPPNTDPSCFDEVAIGAMLTDAKGILEYAKDNGLRYVGEPTYVATDRVVKIDLSIGPDKEVHLAECWSIENYDILNADGTSAITSDWPRRERFIFVVRKHSSEWQLADMLEDPEGNEC